MGYSMVKVMLSSDDRVDGWMDKDQGLACRAISFSCLQVDLVISMVRIIISAAQIQGADQPVCWLLDWKIKWIRGEFVFFWCCGRG